MDWQSFGYIFFAVLFMVLLFFMVRKQRQLFTKENITKSFGTVGWLAILMIGVVALCVLLLK